MNDFVLLTGIYSTGKTYDLAIRKSSIIELRSNEIYNSKLGKTVIATTVETIVADGKVSLSHCTETVAEVLSKL